MKYKVITELAYTYIGLVTTMTKHYVDDGIPLIFNSSIKVNGIDTSKPVFLDYEFAEKNKNRMHKKDDVVTVHTGDIGVSAVISDDLDGSLGFATIVTRINDFNILLPEYLCAFLNYGGGKEQLYKYSRDARNNLNLTDYNKLIVPVPSIERQREIVDQVNRLKGIIANRIQELQLLDELIKARFVELFGDKSKYKVEPLNDNVEEMFIGPFGSALKKEYFVDEDDSFCMVYEQKHAIQKTMDLQTRYVDEKKYNELKRFTVLGGDIIVSCRGTIGEIYSIPDDAPVGIMHPSIMKIRLKKEKYCNLFFVLMFEQYMQDSISKAKGSGVKMAVTATELGKELFVVPDIEEQMAFESFVKQVDKSKVANLHPYNNNQKRFTYKYKL